jgi:arginine deiminase
MLECKVINEIGNLEAVLIHEPGKEVENMSPTIAERALYSDILNLSIARKEFNQLKSVLGLYTQVFEIKPLLKTALKSKEAIQVLKKQLNGLLPSKEVENIIRMHSVDELAGKLIEGIEYPRNTLVNFLQKESYMLSPLHNIFYSRDASFIFSNSAYKSCMAKKIRQLEPVLMELIFRFSGEFNCQVVEIDNEIKGDMSFEGGDIIALSENVIIVGMGSRTSAKGIDKLLRAVIDKNDIRYVFVQELPDTPESFIHLDMVFTLIDKEVCVIYEPLILHSEKHKTIRIDIKNKEVDHISLVPNLIKGLEDINVKLQPVPCGGGKEVIQEREQWHSGANFFALAPGKIMGYERNEQTNAALAKEGYQIIPANEIIQKKKSIHDYSKCLITIGGSELARGGGGARCMTMPLRRSEV